MICNVTRGYDYRLIQRRQRLGGWRNGADRCVFDKCGLSELWRYGRYQVLTVIVRINAIHRSIHLPPGERFSRQ